MGGRGVGNRGERKREVGGKGVVEGGRGIGKEGR